MTTRGGKFPRTAHCAKCGQLLADCQASGCKPAHVAPSTIVIDTQLVSRLRFFIDGLAVMGVFTREPHQRALHDEAVTLSRLLTEVAEKL